jgi:tRNA modification GTPase
MSARDAASTASLLTPPGSGAIAVVAAAGEAALAVVDARFRAANGRPISAQPVDRIVFGHWSDDAGHREEVVVCRPEAREIEIHCHGGVAAAERILSALAGGRCRVAPWAAWVRKHAASEIAAEADIALASAATLRTAAILLDQRSGALDHELAEIAAELAAGRSKDALARIDRLLERAALGRRLTQPWEVAIAGRPNVGKSSLINALVGYQRAIVFDEPGTTRDVLAAETAIDGWPVRLTDAAGLRSPADELEAAGVSLAKERVLAADLVVWVLDATVLAPAEFADSAATARTQMQDELGAEPAATTLTVVNKIDMLATPLAADCVAVSARTGVGSDTLLAAIAERLVPNAPQPGQAVPFTPRQIDVLRETALRGTSRSP